MNVSGNVQANAFVGSGSSSGAGGSSGSGSDGGIGRYSYVNSTTDFNLKAYGGGGEGGGDNAFRVLDGKMSILSGRAIRADGCFVQDDQGLFVEDGAGLFCG